MDEADMAQAAELAFLAEALRRTKHNGEGSGAGKLVCVDCEAPIPARRRLAVPGCTRCRDCQDIWEKENGR